LTDARHVRSTADYWQSAYAALQPKRDAAGSIAETDPDVLMLAANAAFRTTQGETDRNAALRKLDGVVKGYAEVLKAGPTAEDAAYNYEYAIRLRDALAKARPAPPGKAVAAQARIAADEGDLPVGPTLHGRPGGPPAK